MSYWTETKEYMYVDEIDIHQVYKICIELNANDVPFNLTLAYCTTCKNMYTLEIDMTGIGTHIRDIIYDLINSF